MELSLSARLALPLSPAAGTARPRRPAAFACRCCSGGASHDGTTRRRWLASLLAATAVAVGIGVAGGDADAVSTSRRALRSAKIPESEFTTLPNGLKFCYRVTGRQTILCYFPFSECRVTSEALSRYYDITVGSGLKAVKGSRVAVHYVAKWKGITFMTSRQGLGVGGGTPYGFDIGNSERGNVLKGLDLGVEGMKVGGQRLIIVPPELAYGKKGVQEIPPNATIEMVAQASDSSSEVSVNRVQDDQRMMMEDVDSLKRMVSALEEQAASIESQFHDYCDMKEQESTYQKMQIMCLGMKLEQLESQNQRLEAAAAEIRASAEEFATMRARFDAMQSKSKKIWKKNKQDLDAIDERVLALDAREAEMATRCQGFEQFMEEMKQLTLQLQKEKGTNNENVEVIVERSMRKLGSSGRDVLDGLEALRDRWAADMEEMIYLGWITAWLQHDLLVLDGGEVGTPAAIIGDETPAQPRHKGEKVVVAVAPSNEVELCKAASASSSSSSEMRGAAEPSCMMGFVAGGCRSIGRPRLLRRLRGWAGGKGGNSRRQCKIEFPTSPM
uniref:peptidylprolyl isomerase n=2 Tax=Oryza glaberrima TaxID=4538 RepID=I1Q8N6_ORYGL